MKSRQLILLLVAALVLGGGGLWVLRQRSAGYEQAQTEMGGSLLGPLDVNAVAALRITQGSNSVNVIRDGQDWVVRERGNYPANFADLANFVRKLAELKVARPVTVGASRLALLELSPGSGVVVDLLGSDGKALKTLRLGKQSVKGGGDDPMGGGGFPDGRYVQVGDHVSLISDPLGNARPAPADWLAKEFIKVEQPVFIQVTQAEATNSFTLTRTNEFADWTLNDAAAGETLDKNKLWNLNTLLSAAGFNDLILSPDAAKLGLDHPTSATIKTAGGFAYELKLGQPEGENYPVQVTVSAQLPTQRTPAADEKPEDKERLDKEFKEKLAKLEQKLKAEQALGKWTFAVSKFTVEPLLKKRAELLADKKAEAPGGAGANGIPSQLNPLSLPNLPGAN